MRRQTVGAALMVLAVFAGGCGGERGAPPPRPPGPAAGAARTTAPEPDLGKLDETVRAFLAREGVRAAHVTVLRGGETVFERGYGAVRDGEGPPTSRSVFPIGSISKQFTAAAVLALGTAASARAGPPSRTGSGKESRAATERRRLSAGSPFPPA